MSEEKAQEQTESPLEYFVQPYLQAYDGAPIHRIAPKMGRNDKCFIFWSFSLFLC
jgi:hypothetical protein